MNSFEIIGQAKLDAAEGQLLLARQFRAWLRQVAQRLRLAVTRHRADSRVMPW